MNDDEKAVYGCVGAILAAIALFAVSALMNGWALVKLWGWFILPLFESAPVLTIVQAIGIGMVASFLTSTKRDGEGDNDKGTTQRLVESFAWAIGYPLMTVLFGWAVAGFL